VTENKKLSTIEKVVFLKSVDVFAHATIEQLGRIAALTEEVNIDAGETVFREGERTDAIYLVVDGTLMLERNKQIIGEVGSRGVFGAVAALDLSPAVHTVTTMSRVHALKLNVQDFHDLLSQDFELVKSVFQFLCQLIRETL
jgi:CRP-like cAMP-binding protein